MKHDDGKQSDIVPLLRFEEGVKYSPYVDSLGYPTVGIGFKIGTQGADIHGFDFTLGDYTIDAWLTDNLNDLYIDMADDSEIAEALEHCNTARCDILTSMAYQMGVAGLGEFHHMLAAIVAEDWQEAAAQMMESTWADQTPERAERHAGVMAYGKMGSEYDF